MALGGECTMLNENRRLIGYQAKRAGVVGEYRAGPDHNVKGDSHHG